MRARTIGLAALATATAALLSAGGTPSSPGAPVAAPLTPSASGPSIPLFAVPVLPRTPAPTPTAAETPAFDAKRLRRAVARYLAGRPGRAGLMVRDLRTGTGFGYKATERFMAASVMKVNVLAGLLVRQKNRLSASDRALAANMIRYSDNAAADTLYARVGFGPGLARANRAFRLKSTVPYSTRWGASSTTPADQVKLLEALVDDGGPLSARSRRYILDLMAAVVPGQRWGVSAAARKGERVALKNGWTPVHRQGTGWAVTSIGRITGPDHDFLIAIMSIDQPDMGTGVQTIEHLAETAVDALRTSAA